jgi:hypothetical protein
MVFTAAYFSFALSGCASWMPPSWTTPEKVVTSPITELWEPAYVPDFAFDPIVGQSEMAGCKVAIIDVSFSYSSVPSGEWEMAPPEEAYRRDFVRAFSRSLEKILTAKGMEAIGPYRSYDDMTFTERSRCDFVILPSLLVEFEPRRDTLIEELFGYAGPFGEPIIYGRSGDCLDARARLEYEVIDPRTRKQLDRHVIRSDPKSKEYDRLWSQWTMNFGNNSRTGWRVLEYSRKKYPNYHNADNATGKILEAIYHDFMPRLDGMLSAGEFGRLEEMKMESRRRE